MSDSKNLLQITTQIVDPETGKPKLICEFCCVTFSSASNLRRHLRKLHNLGVKGRTSLNCGLCDKKFRTITILQEHIQNDHSITLKFFDKTFYSQKEFLDWKTKVEKESMSSFRFRNTNRLKDEAITVSYYVCHRSGQYNVKQNRIRNLKALGSIKSGCTCPALMKVSTETVDGISEIKVNFQSVHIGHDLEVRTIRLTKEERANFASCLKLGMSIDKILEQAKQNPSPTNRYRFLTRKHLYNICRDCGIKLNAPKTKKQHAPKDINAEASDSSNNYGDYLEVEVNNYEDMQENEEIYENKKIEEKPEIKKNERIKVSEKMQVIEKSSAVSSLLLLQNHNYSDDLKNRKRQVVNQLKELQLRIDKWDSTCCLLSEVEEHVRALNAILDISAF